MASCNDHESSKKCFYNSVVDTSNLIQQNIALYKEYLLNCLEPEQNKKS
ncbi:MAG: hypothetical protein P857_1120 [Candidatus Xenolissoclinum pacificiensis L6]|uniref:Uncharacterized protein n=1 Tax=Candidatus Xenolissoclinum pacificiensis L6 TaxID=1401685 RepID=W2V1E0_9RICK|nr:MAG: hypothetical protein P857_1120 [Candidatus Xenolissoclinum pacificiensis L6]